MSDTDLFKPCRYREYRDVQLVCTITDKSTENYTNLTKAGICNKCQIPDIIKQVNCINLIISKYHYQAKTQSFDTLKLISEKYWQLHSAIVAFDNREDYKHKCSSKCFGYQPVHRDLSTEETISLLDFDATKANDRKLRQAVLAILYKYHDRHPERYNHFDVTPEFIAKSLVISVADVVRVVSPMEDEGEVKTFRYVGDFRFRYVRITSKGIQMIDEEPLFERLDTAGVRIMGDYFSVSPKDSQVGAMNVGSHNHNQNKIQQKMGVSATDLKELFTELRDSIDTLPTEQQEEATELVNALEEEAQSPNPRKARIKAYAEQLGLFLRDAGANALGSIVGVLLAAG